MVVVDVLLLVVVPTPGGKTVTCIFAFIKMDDFSTLCSSLEEDVCTYINTIARIVHVDIVNNHGAPNKVSTPRSVPDQRASHTHHKPSGLHLRHSHHVPI